jgi:hypothetical protein
MTETVTVRLRYATEGDAPWDDEASAWFAAYSQDMPDPYDQEGSIFVTAGERTAQVHDQLLYVVPTYCFDAVVAVLQSGVVEFTLANAATGVRLTLDGDELEIVSNVFPAVRFPKWLALEGLVACGERFLGLMQAVWADAGYDDALADISEHAKLARKALDAAKR